MHSVAIKKKGRVLWKALAAQTLFEKARGLMFKTKAIPLLFDFGRDAARANAIHSFFCPRFDAVFLDSRKKIVCVMHEIRPFKLFLFSKQPARYLIELPRGEARKARLRLGDKLEW